MRAFLCEVLTPRCVVRVVLAILLPAKLCLLDGNQCEVESAHDIFDPHGVLLTVVWCLSYQIDTDTHTQ
jgi:hypothetical protein